MMPILPVLRRRENGFTIIELVMVISLLTLTVGVSGDIILSLIRSYNTTQVSGEIEQNANFVLLKMEKELRNAVSISTPALGTPGNLLTFANSAGDVTNYRLNGNKIDRQFTLRGQAAPGYVDVTDNSAIGGVSVNCPSFCFTVLSISPYTVRLNIVFSQVGNPGQTTTVTVDNTIVLRGSY